MRVPGYCGADEYLSLAYVTRAAVLHLPPGAPAERAVDLGLYPGSRPEQALCRDLAGPRLRRVRDRYFRLTDRRLAKVAISRDRLCPRRPGAGIL
jgi:hypothetical protein